MDGHGVNDRSQAWSRYWSSGRLHSCAGSYAGNYDGAIGRFWRSLAAGLAEQSRVLDLATGNGPLPLLLWESRADALQIDAVDLAALAPAWYRPELHRRVNFHAGVRMEALPFADGSFDCVVSQFGFEYADRQLALAECLRVSRPRATLALVMHHHDSVLVRIGREELAHHARLQGEDGLLPAARAAIPWIARSRSGAALHDDSAAAARARYNHAMQALVAAVQASPAPDLLLEVRESVHRLLAGVQPGNAIATAAALEAYATELEGARLRTAEMVEHALRPEQLEAMAGRLREERPRTEVGISELVQAEGMLGWAFVAGPGSASD